jgi:putative transposase
MPQKRLSAEHTIAKLCRIEVQLAQGKCLALACKDTSISKQGSGMSA